MSYFSDLLTATKSRYQSIRGEAEHDGDTEDDSHISHCLRAYYTEQGRPIPDWLGGGPPPVQSLRGTHGNPGSIPPTGRGRGQANLNASLSDIWDKPGQQGQQFQNPRFGSQSQRQNLSPNQGAPPPQQHSHDGAGKVMTSAQQRIKDRLWGGRTTSPPPSQPPSQPPKFAPPPPAASVQIPGEHQFGGGPPPSRSPAGRQGKPFVAAGMPWDDDGGFSNGFDGAPGVPGYYGGGESRGPASGGNLRRPAGGSGGRIGLGMRQQREGGY